MCYDCGMIAAENRRAALLNGRLIADEIKTEVAERVRALREKSGLVPTLAALLVGDDPASAVYVRNKVCASCGFGATAKLRHYNWAKSH